MTSENFVEFAKAHELAQEGKIDEANAIRAKLGLTTATGTVFGVGQGKGACRFIKR